MFEAATLLGEAEEERKYMRAACRGGVYGSAAAACAAAL